MQITLAVLADAANRADSGKLNLLGVFQSLFTATVPCQHPQMALVLNFEATSMERGTSQQIGIRLVDDDGKAILTIPDSMMEVPRNSPGLNPGISLIVNLNGVMFEKFGAYRFDITVNGNVAGQVPLHVIRAEG